VVQTRHFYKRICYVLGKKFLSKVYFSQTKDYRVSAYIGHVHCDSIFRVF